MNLSPHFTLAEMTITRHGPNRPDPMRLSRLRATAWNMEHVRSILGGTPVFVTSAFRSPQVNEAAGGVRTSDHLTAYAVDFQHKKTPRQCCEEIIASGLPFDQLILEPSWVHISFAPALRGQVLTMKRGGQYLQGLQS